MNNLEQLGDKELLVLMDSYNIEIFLRFVHLSSLSLPHLNQFNVEIAQNRSEDNSSISRIQSFHLLFEVDDHDEEECSVFFFLDTE